MSCRNLLPLAAIVMAAALFSPPVLAQTITTLQVGASRSGTATTGVDLYRVGGSAGTELTLTLTGQGSSGLIFYTPDGQEMVAADGAGEVRLSVMLPLDDVFVVAVVRKQKTPYVLKLNGVAPDPFFAGFAAWVGYSDQSPKGVVRTQCWVDPGRQIKSTYSDGRVVFETIGRGGKIYHEGTLGERRAKWETLIAIEGNEFVETQTFQNGRTSVRRYPIDSLAGTPNGGFVSYRCS